jgi:hypothetical protein
MQYPPQGYPQQQAAPKKSGGGGGCLGACLAALCCCCVAEEGCEACADCAGTFPLKFTFVQPILTTPQNVAKDAAKRTLYPQTLYNNNDNWTRK